MFAVQAVDEASGVMQKISSSVGLIGMELQQLGPGFAQVGQIMQGFAFAGWAGAAIVGVGEITQGLQASVQAASDSQSAWTLLQQSLHLTGDAWAAQQPQIETFVSSLEHVTTVSQTAAVGGLQLLATYGMNATQAEQALSVAADLSVAKHIDLNTAVNLVGKAFDGVTTTLTRYGIIIQTTAKANADLKLGTTDLTAAIQKEGVEALQPFSQILDQAGITLTTTSGKLQSTTTIVKELVDAWKAGTITTAQMNDITKGLGITFDWTKAKASDYNDIIAQLNEKFGGAAQAQLDTYAGKTQQLANEWQDIQVQVGTLLLPVLKDVVDWLDVTIPKISSWIATLTADPMIQKAWQDLLAVFASFKASGDLQKVIDFAAVAAKVITLGVIITVTGAIVLLQDTVDAITFLSQHQALNILVNANITAGLGDALRTIQGVMAMPTTFLLTIKADTSGALTLISNLTATLGSIPDHIVKITADIGGALGSIAQVVAGLSQIVDKIITITVNYNIPSLPSLPAGWGIPGFQVGGMVPEDMLAFLHKGEEVLTPAQQAAIPSAAALAAPAAPGASPNLNMSVPITTTLNVDGQRIAKIVEQRSIIRRNMASAYR